VDTNKEEGKSPQYGKIRTRKTAARNFARKLRKKSTDAEKEIWRLLRNRRFTEFKFRRQYPCGTYFIDFFCTIAKLAVELDGGGHGFPDQRTKDEKRNQFLAKQGIKVLRFWNHQVRNEPEGVRFEIWYALMERTGRRKEISVYLPKPAPSPQPSPPMGAREPKPSTSIEQIDFSKRISVRLPKAAVTSRPKEARDAKSPAL
jgi:very-short-patch-repair endonuclease